jgi:glycerate dehydrogenase
MGIIGFGKIGSRVANLAAAFGMDVIVNSHNRRSLENWDYRWEELDVLLAESDVVSLHCPLLPSTRNMINKETLSKMKSTAFLINTSRGPMVQEGDLADALNSGLIAGAGLDVLSEEPPTADNPLLSAKNCIITPHIAWATKEARIRLMSIIAANLEAYLLGKPVNVVN